jgi:uncharacterized membrane protein YbhN (UPF0104 family)
MIGYVIMSCGASTSIDQQTTPAMSATKIERHRPPRDATTDGNPGQRPRIGRRLATAVLLGALVISLLLAVPGLKPVADEIGEMSPGWIALAVALELLSCVSFVVLFRRFFDRVPGRDARPLAWTSMASGALLPGGGVGGLAIGGWLIRLTGASTSWIIRRSSALFFLTTAVNAAVVIIAALLLLGPYPVPDEFSRAELPLLIVVPATLAIAALPWALRRRNRTPSNWLGGIVEGIRDAELIAARPSWRLLGALGYLGFDIAVLWATFSAVGHVPPIPALALGYTVGYIANAIPIPGGVGVLDAGLSGALVLYGASPSRAVAAVLVYHAIAFWIPALGGIAAYASLRPRLVASPRPLSPTLEGASDDRRSSDDRTHEGRLGRLPHERPRARPLPRNRGAMARAAIYPPVRPGLSTEQPRDPGPQRGPPAP